MSVVSSVLSTRSTGWRINVRFSSLMDSIFAIGFGLGLRFVVDTVSHQNFKLTGTLVGLWEGVIMLHFLKKMPKSSDPYIAYGVRIFIDFLFTESLARTVLVLIWTALGMVLADITPAIWDDVGLKRIWKGFRRDLYTISRMIPTVAFFPPARTVRFSPSREPSVIVEPTEALSPSEITNQEPLSIIEPPFAPTSRDASKRRLPGYFHLDYSDTETDAGSVRIDEYTAPGRTSRRLSVYPQSQDFDDSTSDLSNPQDELDDANLSSLPSDVTETVEPPSALPDASEIPEMHVDEEPLLIDTAATAVKPEDGEVTPTQGRHIFMPPTPSDSAPDRRFGRRRDNDDPLPVRPPSEFLPQIPDFLEEATTEDWEKIRPEEYEKPPTPPAKDRPVGLTIPKVPVIPPPQPPTTEQSHPAPKEEEGWDTLDSQILTRPPEGNSETDPFTNNETTNRDSQLPTYDEVNFDDIYDDPPRDVANDLLTGNLIDNDTDLPPAHVQQTDAGAGFFPPSFDLSVPLVNPWGVVTSGPQGDIGDSTEAVAVEATWEAENARLQEEQEQIRAAEVAAQAERARQKEEEEEKRKLEEAAKEKEKERKAQERKAKREAEKAEMAKKEMEDEIARKKRVAEAEEAEKQKKEQKKKDAEDARLRREEAAEKKAEEVEKKKRAEEAEKIRKEEEAEKRRKEEEEQKEAVRRKKEEEQEAVRRKEEEEEQERRRKEQEEAEKTKQEEEEEKKRKEEEEEKRQKEQKEEELKLEDEKRSQELEQQRLKGEADKQAQEEERLKGETMNQEDIAKEEADKVKTEAEALNTPEPGQPTPNGNGEQIQDDNTLTRAHAPEQLTPRMSPRELDENSHPIETQAPSSVNPITDTVDLESVISEAPPDVERRVEHMLLLRGQMIDIQNNIEETKAAGSDYSGLEKVLRKMERKAQKKYASGILQAEFLKDSDNTDTINMDSLNSQRARQRVAETIERLFTPDSQNFSFSINFNKQQKQKAQKPEVTRLLRKYNLSKYISDGSRKITIDVSEKNFAEWITGYRTLATQEEEEEDDGNVLWQ